MYNYKYTYTYADACRNIFNAIKTSGHSSLERYISHFIERVVCETELETEQRLQHIDTRTLLAITAFLSRSPGLLNRGPGGPASAETWFSFQWTDLNLLSPVLYNNLTSTYFRRASQFALNSTPRQSRSPPDIFDRMHLLFTQVHISFDSLAGSEVNMPQYFFVPLISLCIKTFPPKKLWVSLLLCTYVSETQQ